MLESLFFINFSYLVVHINDIIALKGIRRRLLWLYAFSDCAVQTFG